MNPQTIVIDIYSVVPDLKKSGKRLAGTPVLGLAEYVKKAQDAGSSVFFIAGAAHDPYMRQLMELYLEDQGIRAVFITHAIPEGFTWFVSERSFPFDGEHFPVS